jgi:hypothetical protein
VLVLKNRTDHDTNNWSECWCNPYIEEVDGGYVIIHNDAIGVALELHPKYLAG